MEPAGFTLSQLVKVNKDGTDGVCLTLAPGITKIGRWVSTFKKIRGSANTSKHVLLNAPMLVSPPAGAKTAKST